MKWNDRWMQRQKKCKLTGRQTFSCKNFPDYNLTPPPYFLFTTSVRHPLPHISYFLHPSDPTYIWSFSHHPPHLFSLSYISTPPLFAPLHTLPQKMAIWTQYPVESQTNISCATTIQPHRQDYCSL